MDPNIVIAIVTFSAVLSPVITNWINNEHQLKLRKLEIFEIAKYEAIKDFTKSFQQYYWNSTARDYFINFNSSVANLHIYFSTPNDSLFDELKKCVTEQNYNKAQYALDEIVKYLSSQLNK